TDSNVQIVAPLEANYGRLTFSPDGNFIYFYRSDSYQKGSIYRVPVLGGDAVKLISNAAQSGVTFSPDGKQIAFKRTYITSSVASILIASADGSNEREIVKRAPPEDCFEGSELAWSPDGKRIASSLYTFQTDKSQLVEIGVEDGSIKPINADNWSEIGRIAWLPDSSGMLAIAKSKGTQNEQIYLFAYPGGEARRITNDTNSYEDLGLTADGKSLTTLQGTVDLDLYSLSLTGGPPPGDAQARQITHESNRLYGDNGLAIMPNGRIVYSAYTGGHYSLWSAGADGSDAKRLIEDESSLSDPVVSPDGKYIVITFWGKGGAIEHIWRMNADGTGLTQITNGTADGQASFMPDGKEIVFKNYSDDKGHLRRTSIDGGESRLVLDNDINNPSVSPDGKSILGKYRTSLDQDFRLAILPLSDAGADEQKIRYLDSKDFSGAMWMPDGKGVAYGTEEDGFMNVWYQPLSGGPPKPLTDFKSKFINEGAFSRDGKTLVLSRGTQSVDVVLISNFR
ncbi:MAG: PD40 domain-containing protein, partial [Acidobacteria bacterium]|nr:PD40 domain-containing protein [Acidobacteriota bacterium]